MKPSKSSLDPLLRSASDLLSKRRELYLLSQKESREKLFDLIRTTQPKLNPQKDLINEEIDYNIFKKLNDSNETPLDSLLAQTLMILEEKKEPEEMIQNEKNKQSNKKQLTPKKRKKLNKYSHKFSLPDYITSLPIPDFLMSDWLLYCRPAGTACLIISKKGKTTFRNKNGFIVLKTETNLPGGNRKDRNRKGLFEGVLAKGQSECFLTDVLYYNDQDLMDCSNETRGFWLDTHVFENNIDKLTGTNRLVFHKINKYSCCTSNFDRVYYDNGNYLKNGIVFVKKNGLYIPGANPFLLKWEDSFSNFFWKEKVRGRNFLLALTEENWLKSYDGNQVCQITKENVEKIGAVAGDLVKVEIKLEGDICLEKSNKNK